MAVILQTFQALLASRGKEIPVAISQFVERWLDKNALKGYCFGKGTIRSGEPFTKCSSPQHFPPAGVPMGSNAVHAATEHATAIRTGVPDGRVAAHLSLALTTLALELQFLGYSGAVLHKRSGGTTSSPRRRCICA